MLMLEQFKSHISVIMKCMAAWCSSVDIWIRSLGRGPIAFTLQTDKRIISEWHVQSSCIKDWAFCGFAVIKAGLLCKGHSQLRCVPTQYLAMWCTISLLDASARPPPPTGPPPPKFLANMFPRSIITHVAICNGLCVNGGPCVRCHLMNCLGGNRNAQSGAL